jgi:hypothetical protein
MFIISTIHIGELVTTSTGWSIGSINWKSTMGPITLPCTINWHHTALIPRVWALIIDVFFLIVYTYTPCYVSSDKKQMKSMVKKTEHKMK